MVDLTIFRESVGENKRTTRCVEGEKGTRQKQDSQVTLGTSEDTYVYERLAKEYMERPLDAGQCSPVSASLEYPDHVINRLLSRSTPAFSSSVPHI